MAGALCRALPLALLAIAPLAVLSPGQPTDAELTARRGEMVAQQIVARGVTDRRVLEAMRTVPRHRFVPSELMSLAYSDRPLPIGHDQTISQPYIVAAMTEALGIEPHHTVLEIGTGSGYQAAVLTRLARRVYTIEIVPELARRAADALKVLGYSNVEVRAGDGYGGWPDHAPFDRVMITAAPQEIPKPLLDQMAERGRMVVPVGGQGDVQWLTIVDKTSDSLVRRRTMAVAFVPFTRSR